MEHPSLGVDITGREALRNGFFATELLTSHDSSGIDGNQFGDQSIFVLNIRRSS